MEYLEKAMQFLREVKNEMLKVSWLTSRKLSARQSLSLLQYDCGYLCGMVDLGIVSFWLVLDMR